MKKIIAIVLILCLSLAGCVDPNSPEEQLRRAKENAEWSRKNAESAQKELDDLRDAIAEYEYYKGLVENAK